MYAAIQPADGIQTSTKPETLASTAMCSLRAVVSVRASAAAPAPAPATGGKVAVAGEINRRAVLGGLALTLGSAYAGDARAGFDADLLQPCDQLKACKGSLAAVSKQLAANSDDIDAQGGKYFFESEVERLEANKQYVEAASKVTLTPRHGNPFARHVLDEAEGGCSSRHWCWRQSWRGGDLSECGRWSCGEREGLVRVSRGVGLLPRHF